MAAKSKIILIVILLLIGTLAYSARAQVANYALPPPLEGAMIPELTPYRIEFVPDEIIVYVLNTGPVDVQVAIVQVGGSIPFTNWDFIIEPDNHISRFDTATIRVPFRWIASEPYSIKILLSDGSSFVAETEAAILTPRIAGGFLTTSIILGLYIGVIPVYLGMLPFNHFRRLNENWLNFLGTFAAGVLLFLFVDSVSEGSEIALRLPLHLGPTIFGLGILGGVSLLVIVGQITLRSKTNSEKSKVKGLNPLRLSYMIAFGIGVHNLGEGLVVGAAFTQGLVAFATVLVVGFAIHNLSEGVAMISPILGEKINRPWIIIAKLGFIAGVPTIFGTIIGFTFYSDLIATFFMAIGASAILYVVSEILVQIAKSKSASNNPWNYSGLLTGFILMYVTAVVISAVSASG